MYDPCKFPKNTKVFYGYYVTYNLRASLLCTLVNMDGK